MRLKSTFVVCALMMSCKSITRSGLSGMGAFDSCPKKQSLPSPYTPEMLTRELEKTIANIGKDTSNIDLLADFFPKAQVIGFLSGSEKSLLDFEKKSCSTVDALDKASQGAVGSFSFQTGPNLRIWGGAVLFGSDVFPQYQFEARNDQFAMPKEFRRDAFKEAEEFTRGAPWFEWKSDHFEFHPAGATKRIVEILGQKQKTITLFRGSGRDSSDASGILSFRQNASFFGKDPHDIFQGVFFTTSLPAAIKWANPFVVSLEVSIEDLLRLADAKAPSLWIGFSRGNMDIAILRNTKNQDTLKLLSSIKKTCQLKNSSSVSIPMALDETSKTYDPDLLEDDSNSRAQSDKTQDEPPEC